MIKRVTIFIINILFFSLSAFSQNPRTSIELTGNVVTVSSYTDKEVVINGKTELHITAASNQLVNSVVHLNSADSWLYIDNRRPQFVVDSLLSKVSIDGQSAVYRNNCRVSIYKHGTVVIPQGISYQPLTVYTGQNFEGNSNSAYFLFTVNGALGSFDNKIRSFKLKKGYMATFATASDGGGYSRVFIADSKDLEVPVLSDLLDNKISFIRIFQWEWVTKKGWAGSDQNQYVPLNATWRYDWSAGGSTTTAVEYTPIKQKADWPGWGEINGKQYVSHLLGFNEPNRPDQSNMTVAQALAIWPEYMKSGLRLGAPAPSDPFGSNGAWLYEFLDSCKARNYRVDFVAIHAYWAKSPQQWYNDLKWVYNKTGLPIWITEWNNGANWTSETWPTSDRSLSDANAAKQLNDIKAILNVLDTASFVERYSIYNWVQDCRAMAIGSTITPAGQYYASNKSVMAYNPKNEVIPGFKYRNPSLGIVLGSKNLTLNLNDPNFENFTGAIVEKKTDNGTYQQISNTDSYATRTITDTLIIENVKKVRYRFRSKFSNGNLSAYSNELGYDVTSGDVVQLGNISLSNTGWNALNFVKPYNTVPSVILGAPTNNNFATLVSPRSKLVSSSTRVNIQLAPWEYQKVSSYSKEEKIPYFIIPAGTHDLGGLMAVAGRNTVGPTWTAITFATPFESVPVVFASQILASTSYATTVRVRNVTKTGFEAKIQKESGVSATIPVENVTWVAFAVGQGTVNGNKIIVGKTADNYVSSSYQTINYGETIADPVFLTQMQTCNDDTVTAVLRCTSLTETYAKIVKQRERSTGNYVQAAETAGWLVTSSVPGVNSGVNTAFLPAFSIYPNPVKTKFHISGDFDSIEREAEIFNMSGLLVKRVQITDNEVDVSDLPPGYFVLKSLNRIPSKFVKL